MFARCLWNVEFRVSVKILPASAILEILDLHDPHAVPAVAPQPDGLPLLEHPPRGLEQQPGCRTQRGRRPGGLLISRSLAKGTLPTRSRMTERRLGPAGGLKQHQDLLSNGEEGQAHRIRTQVRARG